MARRPGYAQATLVAPALAASDSLIPLLTFAAPFALARFFALAARRSAEFTARTARSRAAAEIATEAGPIGWRAKARAKAAHPAELSGAARAAWAASSAGSSRWTLRTAAAGRGWATAGALVLQFTKLSEDLIELLFQPADALVQGAFAAAPATKSAAAKSADAA